MTIDELYKIIQDRKLKMPKNSYITSLLKAGKDRIIQKVGEEATELIIAAKNEGKKGIISEVVDLWFHVLVMMTVFNISPKDIEDELNKRGRKSLV
ncbi:phosphoribosyl-ATP diphosphatase [Candidatus Roizmanbacteria bacterium]|nr:phosphoribosyl-ATP diphosphatase [Candidatus Roizmanbacteria bacterium]